MKKKIEVFKNGSAQISHCTAVTTDQERGGGRRERERKLCILTTLYYVRITVDAVQISVCIFYIHHSKRGKEEKNCECV